MGITVGADAKAAQQTVNQEIIHLQFVFLIFGARFLNSKKIGARFQTDRSRGVAPLAATLLFCLTSADSRRSLYVQFLT